MLRTISTGIVTIALAFLVGLLIIPASAQQTPLVEITTTSQVFDLAWSPDGQWLAAATSTGVKLFDNNLTEIMQLAGHNTRYVLAVAWKPDGTQLASGGSVGDHTIRIWDYDSTTGNFSYHTTIPTHSDIVFLLAWSPDGTKLASLVELGSLLTRRPDIIGDIQIWDAETFEPLKEEPGWIEAPHRSLEWSPDSTQVVVIGRNVVRTFDTDSWSSWVIPLDLKMEFRDNSISWSSSNKVAFDDYELEVVDGDTGQLLYILDSSGIIIWHPDGDHLLVSGENTLDVLNGNTGDVLFSIPKPTGEWPWRFAWSADGNRLATGTKDGIIQIWDTRNLPDISGTPTFTPYPTKTPTPSPTPVPVAGTNTP